MKIVSLHMPATVVKFEIIQITYPDVCVCCGAKQTHFTQEDVNLCTDCYEPAAFETYMQTKYFKDTEKEVPLTVIKKILELNTKVATVVRKRAVVRCMYKIFVERFEIYSSAPFNKHFSNTIVKKVDELIDDPNVVGDLPLIELLTTARRMYSAST